MNKEKLQQLGHLAAGLITLVSGFDTFEAGDFSSATYYLSLAIIFLIVAGLHKWIAQKFLQADVAFYLLEAATIGYSGWQFKIKGHPYIFYAMVVAGILYLFFAIASLLQEGKPKHRSKRRKRRKHTSSLTDTEKSNRYNS